jgi:hypothetical protein
MQIEELVKICYCIQQLTFCYIILTGIAVYTVKTNKIAVHIVIS